MWFEIAVIALAAWLAYRVWAHIKSGRSDPSVQKPGEGWKLVEITDTATGSAHLMQSMNDGQWGVQTVQANEGGKSTMTRYATEEDARAAFAAISVSNENHPS